MVKLFKLNNYFYTTLLQQISMYNWSSFPLVRLLLPFIAGIIFAIYLPFQWDYSIYIILLIASIVGLVTLVPKYNFSYKRTWWYGVMLTSMLFLCGYQFTILKTERFSPLHFSNYTKDSVQCVYARLIDPPIEKPKSMKVVMEILAIKHGNEWKKTSGKAMITLSKDTLSKQIKCGDEVIMKVNFKEIPSPQNPGEFNYKRFLAFHNVFQQAFVKSGNWINTEKNSGSIIYVFANNLQHTFLKVLVKNHLQGDEYAVGAALLLGYVDKLDADIIQAYASTGALHVLSVSGLHLTIIFIALTWFLFFLDKIKFGHIAKAIMLLLFIWFYAMLTGLSPAVLRSAAMLSFVIIAKATRRNSNIYNTLAASIFLLLLCNPYLIMDVGFQLSYIAVIGIVYLQPKIHVWYNFENYNWLVRKWWELTAVSIAAQLATFPLGLHYFHQFPNYFLLSNYLVIPISFGIMFIGIAVFVFCKVPFLIKFIALLFNCSIWLLNSSIRLIEKLPHALLQGISISVLETWLIYGIIFLFVYYFTSRKYKYLVYALTTCVVLLMSLSIQQFIEYRQKKLIVYNIPKTSAIDFVSAKANVLFTDTAFAKDESKLLFHVKHNWWDLGMKESKVISKDTVTNTLFIKNNHIQFYDKRIAIVNKGNESKYINQLMITPLNIDYLIVSGNPKIKIEELIKLYKAKEIVFDSSNSLYYINKWKEECVKLNQPYYSVSESGALVVDL